MLIDDKDFLNDLDIKYFILYKYMDWTFYLEGNEKGLSSLYLYTGKMLNFNLYNEELLAPYKKALDDFFNGKDVSDIKLNLEGTSFQKKVWEALRKVNLGETASYKDIAERIGNPKAYQAVGSAVGKNPVMLFVPCHRIIKADGSIGGFSSDPKLKEHLIKIKR